MFSYSDFFFIRDEQGNYKCIDCSKFSHRLWKDIYSWNEYDKNDSYINEIINVIVTALLTPADKKEPFLSIVLIADDHFCNDLTPYLATDRLKELLKEYTKNYKIRLDTQKTVVKTFNEELKKRDA